MSYLDFPRFSFAGQFFTDPSTVDNDPQHYEPSVTNPSPWQEPMGLHYFQFRNCQVVNAWDDQGVSQPEDGLVGLEVLTTDVPSPAKIVDLDVYQQGVSTIFGLQMKFTLADGSTFVGNIDPCSLNSSWFNAVLPERGWNQDYGWGSPGGDFNACGFYKSVVRIQNSQFPYGKSAILDALAAVSVKEADSILFSIRLVLDGYDNVSGGYIDGDLNRPVNQGFRLGRLTAMVGPQVSGDSIQAPGPRWLQSRGLGADAAWNTPSLNPVPFQLNNDLSLVSVDLANGVCRSWPGGPPCNIGDWTVSIKVPGRTYVDVGTFQFNDATYNNNSGIVDFKLKNPEEVQLLAEHPLVLRLLSSGILFQEHEDGLWFAADDRSLRMTSEPNSSLSRLSARVRVTRFGVPVKDFPLKVQVVPVHGDTPGATVPPTNPGDTPSADGALAAVLGLTDDQGWVEVLLSAVKDPGSRTAELDGQLYFLWLYAGQKPDEKVGVPQEKTISVVLWSSYQVNENPSWELVQGIMAPYMKLFPGMRNKIDLTDKNTFFIFGNNPPWTKVYGPDTPPYDLNGYLISSGAIPFYMTREVNDPRYMPLSRDLSPNKLTTVLYYIKQIQQTPVQTAQQIQEEKA